MDPNSPNYYEFSATRKPTIQTKLKKLGLLLMPPVFVVACLAIPGITGINMSRAILFMTPLIIFAPSITSLYLWRFLNIDYEYIIVAGEMRFAAVYSSKSRKELLVVKISEMQRIAPTDDKKYADHQHAEDITKTFDFSSDPGYTDRYFFTAQHQKYGKICVYFNASQKMVQIMRFYNASATVPKAFYLV